VDLEGYGDEYWWGNPEIPTSVHRLTHPTRPTLFVKHAPSLRREYERLLWCQGRLPVPEVVDFEHGATGDRLVTVAIDGVAAHDRAALPDKDIAAKALAMAWRAVHELDVDDCPFDSTPESLIDDVRERLAGSEDVAIWDADRLDYRPARDIYEELIASVVPAEPTVVVHGDASVPNVLVRDGNVAGIVDLGLLGRGDRWWDLTACLGSMARDDNGLSAERDLFMRTYGRARDLERERWYRLLYRLVFDLPAGRARE
jgi:aminoglycoside phosphotransferase